MTENSFLFRWAFANAWSESLGLGTTFILGFLVAPALENMSGVFNVLTTAFMAVVLGIFLEGVLVGIAQGRVLHHRVPHIPIRRWTIATALGAGLAWLIGMIPSTAMGLMTPGGAEASMTEPPPGIQYVLAAGLGLVTGPILGVAQWAVLRKHIAHSVRWLWANALAWAVGMPMIFAGMDLVPWEGALWVKAPVVYLICFVVGLAVGTIHGGFLTILTRPAAANAMTSIGNQPTPQDKS